MISQNIRQQVAVAIIVAEILARCKRHLITSQCKFLNFNLLKLFNHL